ncbi:unnamed protein product [Orchesella dallaii]|uniref:Kazal-like domain-containing protein n=1 Tax=Orchesella dallaii TaxID=48710 RepID=A0ABP1QWR7_9HEXA
MINTIQFHYRSMTRHALFAIVALTVFSSVIGQSQRGRTGTCGCICSQEYIPVCGIDGRDETTFSNRCELQCCQRSRPGLREKFEGVCAEPYVPQEGPQGFSSGQSGSSTRPRPSSPSYGQQLSRPGRPGSGQQASRPSWSSASQQQQQWPRPAGSSPQQVYRPVGPSLSQQQRPRPLAPGSSQQQWGAGSGWVQSQTGRPAVQPSQGSSWGQNPSRPATQPPRGPSSRPAPTRPWWQSSSSQQQQGGSNWRENRGVEDDDDVYDERK